MPERADESVLFRVNSTCETFEEALQRGESPRIEEHLVGWQGDDRRVLFQELLDLELHYREQAGEESDPEQYLERFPDLGSTLAFVLRSRQGKAAAHSQHLIPGSRFGPYTIRRELGRGGMGVVYEARHETLQRDVALKVLPFLHQLQPSARERFLAEARAVARLQHDNVVPVHDVGEAQGQLYYAMQLIEGETLDQRIQRWRSEESDQVGDLRTRCQESTRIAAQIAEALAYAHERGIVHRDVKPSNIIIDGQGTAWLLDFGLARVDDGGLTRSQDLLGTVRYMPPERFRGDGSAPGDIYSLGLTLHECVSLRPAFTQADQAQLMQDILAGGIPALRQAQGGVPIDVETIVAKSTALAAEDRYSGALALSVDLRNYLAGRPIEARPAGTVGRFVRWTKRNPLAASFGLVLILTTVAALAAAWTFNQQRGEIAQQKLDLTAAAEAQEDLLEDVRASRDELRDSLYRSDMETAADAAFRSADAARLEDILARSRPADGEPDLRGWEWHLFESMRNRSSLVKTKLASNELDWHPRRPLLVTTGSQGAALWSPDSSEPIGLLESAAHARTPSFSPDGERIALKDFVGVKVFTKEGGAPIARRDHAPGQHSYHWLDDERLLVPTPQGTLVWSFLTGEEEPFELAAGLPMWVGPDGDTFARMGSTAIHLGSLESGLLEHTLEAGGQHLVGPVEFDDTGTRIAAACRADGIHVWKVADGTKALTLPKAHHSTINLVAFSPDGSRLVSSSSDGEVRVWDAESGSLLRRLNGHEGNAMAARFDPTGTRISSVAFLGELRRWDVSRDPAHQVIQLDIRDGSDLAWDPTGETLSVRGRYRSALVDVTSFPAERTYFTGHRWTSWAPGGEVRAEFQAEPGPTPKVQGTLFRERAARPPSSIDLKAELFGLRVGKLWDLSWSRNGALMICNGVQVSWVSPFGEIRLLEEARDVAASISSDGSRVALRVEWGRLLVREIDDPEATELELDATGVDWQYPIGAPKPHFSPDGEWIATTNGPDLLFFETVHGRQVSRFRNHGMRIRHAAWSPDGQRFATVSEDRSLVLSSPEGAVTRFPLDHMGLAVAWSHDGRRLAALTRDGQLHIWDAGEAYGQATPSLAKE